MFRRIGLPLLALAGIGFSIFMIFWSMRTPPVPTILFNPPQSPYAHYVAGEGTVESFDENVEIGTAFPDLIQEVFVRAGEHVQKGAPLFRLDIRQQEADLRAAFQELRVALTNYKNQRDQFIYFEQLNNKSAVSKQEYTQAYYAMKIAKEQVALAFANVNRIRMVIERSLIIAPDDGTVLLKNARVGEFANVNPFDQIPMMVFGKTHTYQLRVNIAEEDAWRVIPGAAATAFVRGNASIQIPLTFCYIEPLIVPKRALTGSDFEKVDTRVLQIVYSFAPNQLPVYIGQLLDVYVEAKPSKV